MMTDSRTIHYRESLPADDPRYQEVVARPVMKAVDSMPFAFRHLVHEYGYVDVYRAWKRGMSPKQIEDTAERAGGIFIL
jgi:hypothetical protein